MVKAECEWDLGVGYVSYWDDEDAARIYFEAAFIDFEDEVDCSYDEAIKDNLLTFFLV